MVATLELEDLRPLRVRRPKRFLFDLEADNLLEEITTIHCGVVYDLDTQAIHLFTPLNIHKMPAFLAQADQLWGHNIINYDLKAFEKVMPNAYLDSLQQFEGTAGERVFDTMVMCRVIWPDIASMDWEKLAKGALELPNEAGVKKKLIGAHTLRAWGYRLGYFKGNAEGEVAFDTYTPEMLEYCKRDVLLNVRLVELLFKKESELEEGGCPFYIWLEHQFYRYLEFQQGFGVQFDTEFATYLCKCWEKELERRIPEMRAMVPDILKEETIVPKTNNSKYGYVKGVPFTKRKIIPFNPRSGDHVIAFLVNKYEWEPTAFTKKGKPEVTYEVLSNLPYKEAPLLARIKLLMDRLKLVKTSKGGSAWLQCVKPDGRIYGGIIHNGTPTARCRHLKPNLGNIPSAKAIWGTALRKLFVAAKGFTLAGTDFDGLEMRCLAEVLYPYDGGAFYRMAFMGDKSKGTDAHSLNQKSIVKQLEAAGFRELAEAMKSKLGRDTAKTAFYAWLYGAWPKKLGETICLGIAAQMNIPRKKWPAIGKCVQEGFLNNVRGLKKIITILEEEYDNCVQNRKWPHIQLIDGRRVPIRKKSAILNSLLQAMGAILCKLACVLLLLKLKDNPRFGLPGKIWRPVLHVHDEIQAEVLNEGSILSEFADVVATCFREAGEYFKFSVPIAGTTSIGSNWAETH